MRFFSTLFFILLVALHSQFVVATEQTKLFCYKTEHYQCNTEMEMVKYLQQNPAPILPNHIFELYVDDLYQSRLTYREFLAQPTVMVVEQEPASAGFQPRLATQLPESDNHSIQRRYVPDGSLDCEYDMDFTCEEWRQHTYTRELMDYLANMPPQGFVMTQQFIDGNKNASDIIAALVGTALGKPTQKLGYFILKLGKDRVKEAYAQSAATFITGLASAKVLDFSDARAGDILIFDGKGNITIVRPDQIVPIGTEPGADTGGSDEQQQGGNGFIVISAPGGNGSHHKPESPVLGCTGVSGGKMVCTWIQP
jgi:hypothetical protein